MGELGEEIDWSFPLNFCKANRELAIILNCGIIRIITARFMWIVSESLNKSILTSFSKLWFVFFKLTCTYVCEKFASTNRNDSILQKSVIYMHHQLINTNYHINILRY